ncbi:MAG: TerB family tellurite resistance protein, partial [Leptolyngbyaceae cyanobacterium bins.59]|nr:TerB family tellurite resistance protein [Leptolyngbyaceae cyanobacterium bins.59]
MNPPPGISPDEMNVLRIVCSMAWADGEVSAEESDLMLDRFSDLFADNLEQRQALQEELKEYVTQNLPLEELVPKLDTEEDRELALKLGYLVIQASRRTEAEAPINLPEKAAYRRLIELLGVSDETIEKVEWAADQELQQHDHDPL